MLGGGASSGLSNHFRTHHAGGAQSQTSHPSGESRSAGPPVSRGPLGTFLEGVASYDRVVFFSSVGALARRLVRAIMRRILGSR